MGHAHCFCCIPWKYSSLVAAIASFVLQLTICIIFIAESEYGAFGLIVAMVLFHGLAIGGLWRRNICMLRSYLVYAFFATIFLAGIMGWMCYIIAKGNNNLFYDWTDDYESDSDRKKHARKVGLIVLIFSFIAFVVEISAIKIFHSFIDYLICKRQRAVPDPCCVPVVPNQMSQPGMQVNVMVTPGYNGYQYPTQPMGQPVMMPQNPAVPPPHPYNVYPAQVAPAMPPPYPTYDQPKY